MSPRFQSVFQKLASFKGNFPFGFYLSFRYLLWWVLIALLVGSITGSASALFLVLLEHATEYRETHLWIIAFLPVAGFLIGCAYHFWGKEAEGGNNLLLLEIQKPSENRLPLIMAPLVMLSTVLTHLVGGSAGREGTAVQMAGPLADNLASWLRVKPRDRKLMLICSISGGFASVFGTPLAGAVFGLEVFLLGQIRYNAIVPCILTAVIADGVTSSWGVTHTAYPTVSSPDLDYITLAASVVAGICFGITARLFSWASHACGAAFKKLISFPPFRPVLGGLVLALLIWALGTTKYIGLGIPTIEAAFLEILPRYDFALKIALTALTLGSGFKGGEVTPLFFVGATLGNALFSFLPLPLELLVAMGFVAVFAGAANTPLACTLMAIELFGAGCGVYAGIACVIAYLFSGHTGIYGAQMIETSKHPLLARETGARLSDSQKRHP
ncbi:voltage-gated chloride channel family protein [Sabulibacter ruber]|uniref:voltage-gated chloride channel family protein n=1 Tax=Sabulibacter ruber TaxID=2811901 RepID=UPI001A95C1D2|nr:voltage-gated chloride channel family protein [Sabulibacter ruber]